MIPGTSGTHWFAEKERTDGRWSQLCKADSYIQRAKAEVHGPEVDALIDAAELMLGIIREISMAIERNAIL
jgi:hypothetical protein